MKKETPKIKNTHYYNQEKYFFDYNNVKIQIQERRDKYIKIAQNEKKKYIGENISILSLNKNDIEFTGGFITNISPEKLENKDIYNFYANSKNKRYIQISENKFLLRGISYLSALNSNYNKYEKLLLLCKDITEGITALSKHNTQLQLNKNEFLLLLGIADHIKNASITLFNSLSFLELSTQISWNDQYIEFRNYLQEISELSTYIFYKILLGHDSKEIQIKLIEKLNIQKIINYFLHIDNYIIRRSEQPPPLNILLNILTIIENIKKESDIIIIGIPSGGSEAGIVYKFVIEQLLKINSQLFLIPISFHSINYYKEGKNTIEKQHLHPLIESIKNKISKNHNLLIIDDNSCSGDTCYSLEKIFKIDEYNTKVSVVEADVIRAELRKKSGKLKDSTHFEYWNNTISILPVTKGSKNIPSYLDLRRLQEIKYLISYYSQNLNNELFLQNIMQFKKQYYASVQE